LMGASIEAGRVVLSRWDGFQLAKVGMHGYSVQHNDLEEASLYLCIGVSVQNMSDGRLVTNWLEGSRSNIRQTGRSERIEEILLVDICKQVGVSTKPDIAPSFLARCMHGSWEGFGWFKALPVSVVHASAALVHSTTSSRSVVISAALYLASGTRR